MMSIWLSSRGGARDRHRDRVALCLVGRDGLIGRCLQRQGGSSTHASLSASDAGVPNGSGHAEGAADRRIPSCLSDDDACAVGRSGIQGWV